MANIPSPEDQAWLRNHKQVFRGASDRSQWMTMQALRKAVLAGKASRWLVVEIDSETGEPSLVCPWCATGIAHPANASGRLLH
jgi:hypothetical protein